jgi:NAD(P)-dependent dehydrogenase (short-subunit alcohol dehydrogenase family)
VDRCAQGDVATVETFDRLMAVNVRGTMLCYKHAGKQMVAQGRGGRIIGTYLIPPFCKLCTDECLQGLVQ